MQITSGARVQIDPRRCATSIFRGMTGIATGRTATDRYPLGETRAEVEWPNGVVRWPVVRILAAG